MTRTAPTPLRFFAVVQRPPDAYAVLAVVVVAFGTYLARTDPQGIEQTVGITLFLQMFAASTGYRDRLRRGHFDPILVANPGRASVAGAHWLVSIGPGLATWLALAAVDLATSPRQWPLPLMPACVLAFLFVSTTAWTATLALARASGGALWVILLFVLGVSHRLATLTEVFKAGGSSWTADTLQAGAALICPFLVIGRVGSVNGQALALMSGATMAVWVFGLMIISRCDGTLVDPS